MNQMVEKLARIAKDAANDASLDEEREYCTSMMAEAAVIALLTALREPSEEMVRTGAQQEWGYNAFGEPRYMEINEPLAEQVFTAMIDSILPKGGEHG